MHFGCGRKGHMGGEKDQSCESNVWVKGVWSMKDRRNRMGGGEGN